MHMHMHMHAHTHVHVHMQVGMFNPGVDMIEPFVPCAVLRRKGLFYAREGRFYVIIRRFTPYVQVAYAYAICTVGANPVKGFIYILTQESIPPTRVYFSDDSSPGAYLEY